MSNLRGSSYAKQISSGFKILIAFNKSRHGLSTHQTHSNALGLKRQMYLNDYKIFAERRGFSEKLNLTMTNENIRSFLNERLEGLANSTQTNYTRSFHSLIQGLKEAGITIPADKKVFDHIVKNIKQNPPDPYRTNCSVKDISSVISNLHEKRFESTVLAQIQVELGVRTSESYKIIENFNSFYNKGNGTIENLIGKGNHRYDPKSISLELVAKIKECNIDKLPSQDTYRKDLKEVGVEKAKDLRLTYAKTEFKKKIANKVEYKQALSEISRELNHARESMTLYYLARA